MEKIPPMAANAEKGMMGIRQMPRLWMKVLLDAKGLLPEGYTAQGVGADGGVIRMLGLDTGEVLSYLRGERPTYPAFEAWVREKAGGSVPEATRSHLNAELDAGRQAPERRAELLGAAGVADNGTWTKEQVNRWDDYGEFHRYLVASDGAGPARVPPLAACFEPGMMGIVQMPRMWMKVLLDAKGLLPEGYTAQCVGFDGVVVEGLGLDKAEVLDHLRSNLPSYPAFEAWVEEKAGGLIPADVKRSINERILGYDARPERRAELLGAAGVADDGTWTKMVDINRWDDYGEFYRRLLA